MYSGEYAWASDWMHTNGALWLLLENVSITMNCLCASLSAWMWLRVKAACSNDESGEDLFHSTKDYAYLIHVAVEPYQTQVFYLLSLWEL